MVVSLAQVLGVRLQPEQGSRGRPYSLCLCSLLPGETGLENREKGKNVGNAVPARAAGHVRERSRRAPTGEVAQEPRHAQNIGCKLCFC